MYLTFLDSWGTYGNWVGTRPYCTLLPCSRTSHIYGALFTFWKITQVMHKILIIPFVNCSTTTQITKDRASDTRFNRFTSTRGPTLTGWRQRLPRALRRRATVSLALPGFPSPHSLRVKRFVISSRTASPSMASAFGIDLCFVLFDSNNQNIHLESNTNFAKKGVPTYWATRYIFIYYVIINILIYVLPLLLHRLILVAKI